MAFCIFILIAPTYQNKIWLYVHTYMEVKLSVILILKQFYFEVGALEDILLIDRNQRPGSRHARPANTRLTRQNVSLSKCQASHIAGMGFRQHLPIRMHSLDYSEAHTHAHARTHTQARAHTHIH